MATESGVSGVLMPSGSCAPIMGASEDGSCLASRPTVGNLTAESGALEKNRVVEEHVSSVSMVGSTDGELVDPHQGLLEGGVNNISGVS
ncbi:hypothetical protein GUJ93_ZPchr0007g3235 [Zizania palustris]|uniref:Uncharacterized protein n=1 Tax=Zizania palustris TaxID=103762 RepID=A0A8J5W5C1_ZIZPA|nr:hypothetical protein GUJ93_ZPchr0007g3235 [Zizania palustris]